MTSDEATDTDEGMSNDDDESTRTRGVEFEGLADDLESESYPMEKGEVVEQYGDRELAFSSDETTVRDALGPMGETTYDSARAVEESILTMVGDDAVGREGYTDRGVGTAASDDTEESL